MAAGNIQEFNCVTATSTRQSSETNLSSTNAPSLSQYKDETDETDETGKTSGEKAIYSDNAKNLTTLNILGMQPTFLKPDIESQFTSYTVMDKEESDGSDAEYDDEGSSTKRMQAISPASVATQALIDTESIPDTPLSTHSSENASAHFLSTLDSFELSELKIASTIDGDYSGGLESQLAKDSSGLVEATETENSGSGKLPQRKAGIQKRVTLISLPQTPVSSVTDTELISSDQESVKESVIDRIGLLDDRFELISVLKNQANEHGPKSVTLTLPSPHRADSRCTHYTHSTAPFSWVGGGVLGSQVPPSTVYQQSILSLSQSIGSDEVSSSEKVVSVHCFNTWPMEVQLAYVLNMGDIVIGGADSNIQRMALLGPENDVTSSQYSLVKLSGFENSVESKKSQGDLQHLHVTFITMQSIFGLFC